MLVGPARNQSDRRQPLMKRRHPAVPLTGGRRRMKRPTAIVSWRQKIRQRLCRGDKRPDRDCVAAPAFTPLVLVLLMTQLRHAVNAREQHTSSTTRHHTQSCCPAYVIEWRKTPATELRTTVESKTILHYSIEFDGMKLQFVEKDVIGENSLWLCHNWYAATSLLLK